MRNAETSGRKNVESYEQYNFNYYLHKKDLVYKISLICIHECFF